MVIQKETIYPGFTFASREEKSLVASCISKTLHWKEISN
jgi:hypothetical protein